MNKYDNILTDVSIDISVENYNTDGAIILTNAFGDVDKLYSYVVYAIFGEGKLKGWNVHCHISQMDSYNTIDVSQAITNICTSMNETLSDYDKKYVIGYEQPPLEILVTTLEPLVHKLAREQAEHWPIEYEDLCQICRLCICKLYKNGYYIHKNLLRRTFINEVLIELRPDRYKPIVVSLDALSYSKEGSDDISIVDTIADENDIIAMEEREDEDVQKQVNEELKAVIVEQIGVRQYDQLLRDYGNKMTTNWSRKTMQSLKDTLKRKKIDSNLFRRYY